MMDLGLLSLVAFSKPSAPAPDPELERQRAEREAAAKEEKIALAKKEAKQASYEQQRKSRTMLAGYGGYTKEDGTTLG